MRKLAIDVGEKSLGVCISDKNNIIAIPLKNYFFERFNFEEASLIILDLLEKYKDLDTLIIGYPLKTNGTKTKATEYVEIFLKYLKAKINQDIKIFLFDERFTTKRAEEIIKNKKIDYKKNKDLFAAYVMLTDYLQKV
ncbi:Putative Holliday junction resolvase [Candidatus Hepatoplasma crinochetorum Av]|uniref:Putative pre-16S rRNA nuclease n=1 Tax=Candidatus Hepatoplasma crinochetorum Av TaxID=1427984 RepID=W8GFS0_9MOLU|nr:Holliday junction resolvase RuvX [Candidatus Hepatoplasma crinochetorum]AHK22413.1 Putative Holliday junction resolvase [Candidatus Hepatoplasma crinochetorum Av]